MKKFYGTIEKSEKQADGTMIVMGYCSSESKDVDGEIIKADAVKAALPDYMKYANVREMHKADKASGVVLEMEVQDDGRTWVKTHIVDSEAVKKVENKVYKGFSIGGKVTERDADDKKIIKGIRLNEISLVDRPANPDSVFTFAKVEDATKETATEEPQAVVEPAAKPEVVETEKKPETTTEEPAKDAVTEGAGDGDTTKTEKPGDLKKGMYAVSRLASILSDISYITSDAQYEAEFEGDGSTMPGQLKAWLKTGGELLKAMVTEEVAEMVPEEVTVEVIALADKATNLMKVACSPEDAAKFEAFVTKRQTDIIAKAGKRNSTADQKHLDAIHDAACAMGAACNTTKAHGTDDLQKVAGVNDKIRKALGAEENEDLLAKVEELVAVTNTLGTELKKLQAMPKPSKAITKVIEKVSDAGKPENATDSDDKTATPVDAMKKVWASGGRLE